MQAIVNIAGSQFCVKQDDTISVPLLKQEVGANITLGDVIATTNGSSISKGGSVSATVLAHGKDETVLVFHKKRRKGYQKLNGHRQPYTQIKITGISA